MSLPNLGGMFVESLQMCTEGMVCRTSINYHNGNKEYIERGLCHLQKVLVRELYYTKCGKKDAETGDIDESTSFVSILSDCADFKKEFSILEMIAERYNSMIWFTPRYHCEIAGEGVEYMWGYCKRLFCRVPLAKRRKKADFENTVRNTVSSEMVPPSLIRRFSRRARQYICVYHHLHSETADADTIQVSLKMIEKLVKNFKTKCA